MDKYYFGTIEAVYDPDHKLNFSKYQYEYKIIISGDDYAQIPVTAIVLDEFGSPDNYRDKVYSVKDKVFVKFPKGDRSMGVIEGGVRSYTKPQKLSDGKYFLERFNRIETKVDKYFVWSVTSDYGPKAEIHPDKIVIDDSQGQRIVYDKKQKIMTIDATTLNINVTGNATVTVNGDLTANVKGKTSVTSKGEVSVKSDADVKVDAKGKAQVKAKGDVEVESKGMAKVKAKMINFNGQAGDILTTVTDPVIDLIFGIPTQGVPNVKAGGET